MVASRSWFLLSTTSRYDDLYKNGAFDLALPCEVDISLDKVNHLEPARTSTTLQNATSSSLPAGVIYLHPVRRNTWQGIIISSRAVLQQWLKTGAVPAIDNDNSNPQKPLLFSSWANVTHRSASTLQRWCLRHEDQF